MQRNLIIEGKEEYKIQGKRVGQKGNSNIAERGTLNA